MSANSITTPAAAPVGGKVLPSAPPLAIEAERAKVVIVMSDEPPKKPDETEARRALVKAMEEFDAAHPDWREGIHVTPEGKWGTPWPEGTKDDPPARWKLFGMRPASMRVQ